MAVAEAMPGVELVSIDSMQVYREMDIGTAKPSADDRARVRHHLIDIADPAEEFTVSMFQRAWYRARDDIAARGRIPVLVGGTGLYLRAVVDDLDIPGRYPGVRAQLDGEDDLGALYARLQQLDPDAAARIDANNERRIRRALEVTIGSGRPFSSFGPGLEEYPDAPFRLLGLRMNREALDRRIEERYDDQMEAGFLDEVRALASRPRGMGPTARQALGYRELLRHVELGDSLDAVLDDARTRTRRFTRRQLKWFRRDPRISWIDLDEHGELDWAPAIARGIATVEAGGD